LANRDLVAPDESRRGSTHLNELARVAGVDPDRAVLQFRDVVYSAREVLGWSERTARGLIDLGVRIGDRVVIMLPNCPEAVWTWFGSSLCGAVDAPVSVETRGVMLDYYLRDLEARVVIGRQADLERIVETGWAPETAIVVGDWDGSEIFTGPTRHVAYGDLVGMGATHELPEVGPDPTGTIIYTSGTTGPSKGVMLSIGYWMELALNHLAAYSFPLGPGWICYVVQPFCHIDARSILVDCIVGHGKFVMGERFSASQFWNEVEAYDADVFNYIGTMLHLLYKQPDRQTGRTTKRRYAMGSSAPAAIFEAFQERFDVRLIEGYGMTEVPFITSQRIDAGAPGSIGWFIDGIEGMVVDQTDRERPRGALGELVVRPTRPHQMMQGYWRKPEATVEVLGNLWFHTGDLARMYVDGHLEYVGRKKDSIRRRGENVSAWEVEQIATRDDAVKEAAAFGVPSAVGEEDVALLVVPASPEAGLDPVELREHLAANLPRFAVPRFIEVVDSLPKTPSERVAKGKVRERGLTSAAYDAEQAGV
jgi:crotonobetaine/carnitine-CoA ligase